MTRVFVIPANLLQVGFRAFGAGDGSIVESRGCTGSVGVLPFRLCGQAIPFASVVIFTTAARVRLLYAAIPGFGSGGVCQLAIIALRPVVFL